MAKKWVFNALVKSDNDPIGLLAYALYKFQKDEIGKSLRSENETEEEIAKQLSNFHDSTLRSHSSLEDFRNKAVTLVSLIGEKAGESLVKATTDDLNTKLAIVEKEKAQLEKDRKGFQKMLNKEKTKIKAELLEQFKATVENTPKKNRLEKFTSWLLGGFSGIAAQLIVVVFTFGVLALYYGSGDALMKKFSDSITSSLSTPPTVVTPANPEIKKGS
ncbi:hypothetical protein [Aliivibrio fischeri]|uniref:hypothetical protein n=1 Tax=Aliivibrio fischeri TaxID=668 RepID=UPI0007C47CC2|nr:hypothetical protein [Aliivibrio fischeri]